MRVITEVRGTPFITRTVLANQMGISAKTVDNRAREMKNSGRYPEPTIIKDGGLVLINYLAFMDYIAKRERIQNGIPVDDFAPREMAKAMGWY